MRQEEIRYYGERGEDVSQQIDIPPRETETTSAKRVRLCSLFNEEWSIVCDEPEGHKGPHAARVLWGD